MRWNQLPQPTAARLLDLGERASGLAREAERAEAALDYARSVINGVRDISKEVYERERKGFDDVVAAATAGRRKADQSHGIMQACRGWIEALPANTKLIVVNGGGEGDLKALQGRLQGLRDELRVLCGNPPVVSNIGKKVDAYVEALAGNALPFVRGFHSGGTLDVRWPASATADRRNGNDCDDGRCNPLTMFAAMFPEQMAGMIMKAVQETQPLSASEHATRRGELEHAIDELSYACATLLDRAGECDPQMDARHWLGVRIKEPAEAMQVAV